MTLLLLTSLRVRRRVVGDVNITKCVLHSRTFYAAYSNLRICGGNVWREFDFARALLVVFVKILYTHFSFFATLITARSKANFKIFLPRYVK